MDNRGVEDIEKILTLKSDESTSSTKPCSAIDVESEDEKESVVPKLQLTKAWTEEDEKKFSDAMRTYGKDWKRIRTIVGSKSIDQLKTFAQKLKERI